MTEQTPVVPVQYLEAPASWNTKYLDPSGFECQITLRNGNGLELLTRAAKCMEALIAQGCTPVTFKANGKTNGESRVCALHDAELIKHDKDGRVWYSHKLASGQYCNGEPK